MITKGLSYKWDHPFHVECFPDSFQTSPAELVFSACQFPVIYTINNPQFGCFPVQTFPVYLQHDNISTAQSFFGQKSHRIVRNSEMQPQRHACSEITNNVGWSHITLYINMPPGNNVSTYIHKSKINRLKKINPLTGGKYEMSLHSNRRSSRLDRQPIIPGWKKIKIARMKRLPTRSNQLVVVDENFLIMQMTFAIIYNIFQDYSSNAARLTIRWHYASGEIIKSSNFWSKSSGPTSTNQIINFYCIAQWQHYT